MKKREKKSSLMKVLAFLMAFLVTFPMVFSNASLMGNGKAKETGKMPGTGNADVVAYAAENTNELTLKLHYHRADGNYNGWDVWLWEEGRDGSAFAFEDEGGEKVATKTVTPGTSRVGFIVRTADWTKDINADQFIDIAEVASGTVHVYVESGVEGYTKEYAADVVIGIKVTAAKSDGQEKIIVTTTDEIADNFKEAFKVLIKDEELKIKDVIRETTEASTGESVTKACKYTIVLENALDLKKSYKLVFDGVEYKINLPGIYSTEAFEAEYTYSGNDLGAVWSKESTTFRVWAPTADEVYVRFYPTGNPYADNLSEEIPMKKDVNGTWVLTVQGDLNGTYYQYKACVNGAENITCDPYARTTGLNGKRAMVIDLDSTDPEGWEDDKNPHAGESINDAVIYELHIRDLSSDSSSGIKNVGKYLGLTETGTKTAGGAATGLDHIKELGITHLHILPFYDYGSVDEANPYQAQFNWGYDPVNYNVPEGSYSTNPSKGEVRVKEVKQMVKNLHENGISVVMDVVYNHVYNAEEFCVNQLVPGYFCRIDENGSYSNGSGCGNDVATERSMVRKYIVDSVLYWVEEYHIDGFRFDLVGLIDTETMNEVIETVHKEHPDVIFYGEGWTMSTKLTKENYTLTTQTNSTLVPGMSFFSDTIRDGLKGSVFSTTDRGFVSGAKGLENRILNCFMGFADSWCKSPAQSVNYVSCHDNNTLMDRLTMSTPEATDADRIKMNKLAAAIYITAEGTPFMQAGEEFMRSKPLENGGYDSNSYSSPDSVNALKWSDLDKAEYMDMFEYYKGLIAFRKEHAALRLSSAEDVRSAFTTLKADEDVVAVSISGDIEGESADGIVAIFNAGNEKKQISLHDGTWKICVDGEKAGTSAIKAVKKNITVEPLSAVILVQDENLKVSGSTMKTVIICVIILICAVAVIALVGRSFNRKIKKN